MRFSRLKLCAVACGLMGLSSAAFAAGPCPTIPLNSFQGSNQAYLTAGGGCNVIVTATASAVTILTVNPNPYDGSDDSLVGIVNNSGGPLSTLTISGSGISGFEGDGICVYATGGAAGTSFTGDSYCSVSQKAGTDPQDYTGPAMTFSNFASGSAVTVTFTPPLPVGGTSFLSLEQSPSTTLVVTTNPGPTGPPATPAPSSLYLAAIGAVALTGLYLYSRRTA